MQTMYPGKVNSPKALTEDIIGASETTIEVSDGSVLPAAPNLAVLGSGENCETILYTVKTGNILSGITRGFQGTAQEWPAETPIGRNFTEYDNAAMQANIAEIAARFIASDTVVYVSKQGSDSNAGTRAFSPKLTIGAAMSGLTGGVVRVLDAGTYTENVTVPNNVSLDAANATIIGAMTVGNGCSVRAAKIMLSANNTTAVTKTGSEISMVDADVWEGRGVAGTLTGTTLVYNSVAGAILYATGRTFNVAEDGWAVKDNASDNGHIHLNADDVYLFGDDSVGAEVQGPNSHIVIIAQHIITPNGITGTTALKSSNSSARIEATTNEIIAATAALANTGEVAINCPNITGSLTGSGVSVVGRIMGADADLPVFTAANGALATKAASAARSALGAAAAAHAAQHAADGADPIEIGTTANLPVFTGDGGVLATKNAADARAAIGASSTKNLLLNWDFRGPVNQRNVSACPVGTYGLDMWLLSTGNCVVNSGSITLNGKLWQRLEYAAATCPLNGRLVTLSVMLGGGSVKYVVITPLSDAHVNATVDGITMGLYNGAAWKEFGIETSEAVEILAVKIEVGTVSTLASDLPADYAAELLACQRYLNIIRCTAYSGVWAGMSTADGTQTVFAMPLYKRLRIDPTAVITGNIWIKVANTLNWAASPVVAVSKATSSGVTLAFANGTPSAIGSNAALAVGSDDAVIVISAEL